MNKEKKTKKAQEHKDRLLTELGRMKMESHLAMLGRIAMDDYFIKAQQAFYCYIGEMPPRYEGQGAAEALIRDAIVSTLSGVDWGGLTDVFYQTKDSLQKSLAAELEKLTDAITEEAMRLLDDDYIQDKAKACLQAAETIIDGLEPRDQSGLIGQRRREWLAEKVLAGEDIQEWQP